MYGGNLNYANKIKGFFKFISFLISNARLSSVYKKKVVRASRPFFMLMSINYSTMYSDTELSFPYPIVIALSEVLLTGTGPS